jgi:hypothetical protein
MLTKIYKNHIFPIFHFFKISGCYSEQRSGTARRILLKTGDASERNGKRGKRHVARLWLISLFKGNKAQLVHDVLIGRAGFSMMNSVSVRYSVQLQASFSSRVGTADSALCASTFCFLVQKIIQILIN